MEIKINLDITSKLSLNNGIDLEELANNLQRFTSMHLFIDHTGLLKGIHDILEINYTPSELVKIENGYHMREIATGRTFIVFTRELFNLLTLQKCEHINTFFQNLMEETESDFSMEPSSYENPESYSYEIESEASCEEGGKQYITNFRLFLQIDEDEDGSYALNLNPKYISMLEEENDIDIGNTIALSFQTFLERKDYTSEIRLVYHEDYYAEVEITTHTELTQDIIEEIEDEAVLNLDKDNIFFIFRKSQEVDIIQDIINLQDDVIIHPDKIENGLFSSEVPLFNLPDDMIKLIMENIENIQFKGASFVFEYDQFEFEVRSEGNNLYSVFDLDMYFDDLPHLHPDYYLTDVQDYSELPVSQFFWMD